MDDIVNVSPCDITCWYYYYLQLLQFIPVSEEPVKLFQTVWNSVLDITVSPDSAVILCEASQCDWDNDWHRIHSVPSVRLCPPATPMSVSQQLWNAFSFETCSLKARCKWSELWLTLWNRGFLVAASKNLWDSVRIGKRSGEQKLFGKFKIWHRYGGSGFYRCCLDLIKWNHVIFIRLSNLLSVNLLVSTLRRSSLKHCKAIHSCWPWCLLLRFVLILLIYTSIISGNNFTQWKPNRWPLKTFIWWNYISESEYLINPWGNYLNYLEIAFLP